jgi:voltage-gated potassium channel
MEAKKELTGLRLRFYETIFESDTVAGRIFDIALLLLIFSSVTIIVLESVEEFRVKFHDYLLPVEWFFTIVFTLEYIARLWTLPNKRKYFPFYLLIWD